MRALAVVLVLALAGCFGADPPATPSCEAQPLPDIPGSDGAAAMAWVEAIVYLDDGLRPRAPQDAGHPCTADWLQRALDAPGWEPGRSTFSGADYEALEPKGAAGNWISACPAEDKEALPGLVFHNLWAVKEGGDDLVVLAAHWDAKEDAHGGGRVPAANDGASGMGVLLAMQRAIAAEGLSFPFDLAVVFFDGEDGFEDCHPLAGSLHFSRTRTMEVDRLILLDMVGDEEARFPRESRSVQSDPGLVDLIWSKAPEHGLGENFVDRSRPVVDDHIPFIEDGVRAVDIIHYADGFPSYWHTTQDTPDKLSADMLGAMVSLMLDVLQDPGFEATL